MGSDKGEMKRECVCFGVIKRQIRRYGEKGGEKEREGEREGYSNIVGAIDIVTGEERG